VNGYSLVLGMVVVQSFGLWLVAVVVTMVVSCGEMVIKAVVVVSCGKVVSVVIVVVSCGGVFALVIMVVAVVVMFAFHQSPHVPTQQRPNTLCPWQKNQLLKPPTTHPLSIQDISQRLHPPKFPTPTQKYNTSHALT
jgi:hypothetical protein